MGTQISQKQHQSYTKLLHNTLYNIPSKFGSKRTILIRCNFIWRKLNDPATTQQTYNQYELEHFQLLDRFRELIHQELKG